MKTKSVLKIWLIAIVAVYFIISWDIIDMPYKIVDINPYSYGSVQHEWEKESKEIFQSKLFGKVKILHGRAYHVWLDEGRYIGNEIKPIQMGILDFVNWFKAFLIILLFSFIASLLKYTYGSVSMMMIAIFYGGFTLCDKSPNYGFSEILILILFLIFLTMQISKKIKIEEKPEFPGYRKMPKDPRWPETEAYELIDKNDHTRSPMFFKLKKE